MPKRKRREETMRSPPGRIIVSFDPGVAIVGYAVTHELAGKLLLLACGVIRTPAKTPLEDRLLMIYEQVNLLLAIHHPTEAAMESLFFGKNRTTAIEVSHARGVILLAVKQQHLPIAHYTPTEVKCAVTGYGRAKKVQVGEMVRKILGLSEVPRPDDAADAAAVAICHVQHTARRFHERK